MKKLLIVLLALSMVFAFAACGKAETPDTAEAETFTAIPLGGGLGDYPLEGAAYGEYVLIDTPAFLSEDYPDCEIACYYSEGSDTPYIFVYRWKNTDGITLEEMTEKESKAEPVFTIYEMVDNENGRFGYLCYGWDLADAGLNGSYFYTETLVMEDGEDFVNIDFLAASEELALGESGKYVWVPCGYEEMTAGEEDYAQGLIFDGNYDESYWMPHFFIAEEKETYENLLWYWGPDYADGFPVDEKTYNGWVASGWDKAAVDDYYKAFDITVEGSDSKEVDGCKIVYSWGSYTDRVEKVEKSLADCYITVGDTVYNAWISTPLTPKPTFAHAFMESLHSK